MQCFSIDHFLFQIYIISVLSKNGQNKCGSRLQELVLDLPRSLIHCLLIRYNCLYWFTYVDTLFFIPSRWHLIPIWLKWGLPWIMIITSSVGPPLGSPVDRNWCLLIFFFYGHKSLGKRKVLTKFSIFLMTQGDIWIAWVHWNNFCEIHLLATIFPKCHFL